jgi:signal transduction histidine kinase
MCVLGNPIKDNYTVIERDKVFNVIINVADIHSVLKYSSFGKRIWLLYGDLHSSKLTLNSMTCKMCFV